MFTFHIFSALLILDYSLLTKKKIILIENLNKIIVIVYTENALDHFLIGYNNFRYL